jgi:hypothetical protein
MDSSEVFALLETVANEPKKTLKEAPLKQSPVDATLRAAFSRRP